MKTKIIMMSLMFLLIIGMVSATTYYVSNSGNDSLSGTSEANAFQTINKSNSVSSTSDTVLFKCGDSWRIVSDAYFNSSNGYGVLPILKNGTPTNRTNYDMYGCNATNNAKPLFLGSFNASPSSFWINRSNITNPCLWTTAENMTPDLGNSIFWEQNGTLHTGVRKQNVSQISQQGDWNYNETTNVYMIYSCDNPGNHYSRIELAVKPSTQEMMFNLDNKANINIANLSLMFTGSSAINGENMKNISILNNNLWYVGGDWQTTTRYGNCIDIQKSASNIQVLNNNVSQCYDGAVTIEAYLSGGRADIRDILIQGNVLAYSQYCVEYFSSNTTNTVTNVSIIGNTCPYNGYEWSHNERYGSGQILNSRAFRLANSPANTTGFNIKDNLVYNARDYSEYLYAHSTWLANPPTQDFNDFWNDSGTVKFYYNGTDNVFNLSGLQSESGQEANGLQVNPLFIDALGGDYRLQSSSPLCNASSSGSYVGALPCAVAPSIVLNSPVGFVYTNSVLFNWTSTNATNVSLYINGTRFYYLPVTPLEDVSGNGHLLTGFGNLSFNSSEDAYYTQSNGYLESDNFTMNNQSFTMGFDFKCFQNFTATFPIVKYDSSSAYETGIYVSSSGALSFYVRTVNETLTNSSGTNVCNVASRNQWYNIVLTFNGSKAELYFGGVLISSKPTINGLPTQMNSTNNSLRIMRWSNKYINGSVRNVFILNTSITASQALLFNNSISPFAISPNNVQVYYPFHNETSVNGNQTRVINLYDGSYNWFVNVTDGTNEVKSSVNQFNVETSGCIAPYSEMNITSDTNFCGGSFEVTNITFRSNNITLDCNNAFLYYNDKSNGNRIIRMYKNNTVVKNCNISGGYVGIYAGNSNYVTSNNTILNTYVSNSSINVYAPAFRNLTIMNLTSVSGDGISTTGHGIYIDGATGNADTVNILNGSFLYDEGGIHLNSANLTNIFRAIIEYNNVSYNNNHGIRDASLINGIIRNNYISYNNESAIRVGTYGYIFGSNNTLVEQNTFVGNENTFSLNNMTYNLSIINNSYYESIRAIVYFSDNSSFRLQENTNQNMSLNYYYLNSNVYFNYSGIKNISVLNNTINITTDGIYNDLRFVNGSLIASDVDSYSLTLLSGQQVEVGDFVQEIVNPVFSVFGSLTIYNKDFYLY